MYVRLFVLAGLILMMGAPVIGQGSHGIPRTPARLSAGRFSFALRFHRG